MENSNLLWRINLLGRLEAIHDPPADDPHILKRFRSRKTGSLLAYLTLHHQEAHAREKLIELLWPESKASAGRNSLRVSLNALRQQLEYQPEYQGQILLAQGNTLQLNPNYCRSDVEQFLVQVAIAENTPSPEQQLQHWQQAISLYTGELLPGDPSDWVEQEAKRLRDIYLNALCSLGQLLLQQGALNQALSYAHQSVRLDPLCENCHFLLIQVYVQLNRPGQALRQYRQLCESWQEEFHCLPSPQIQAWASQFLPITTSSHLLSNGKL